MTSYDSQDPILCVLLEVTPPHSAPPVVPHTSLTTGFIKEDLPFCITRATTRTVIGPCPR